MSTKITCDGSDTFPRSESSSRGQRELLVQVGKFIVVGMICVVIDFTVYRLLVTQAGYQNDFGKAAGYLSGLVVGFFLNHLWTFESRKAGLREPLLYLAVYGVTFVLNLTLNRSILTWLGSGAVAFAFLFATGVTTICNFVGLRLVAFRKPLSVEISDHQ
jgi:putative flippase GtrA